MTAWAQLSPETLTVSYVPILQSSPQHDLYAAIQPPNQHLRPDHELSMRDCVDIRSLRKEEVRGRGIPPLPEGGGCEILELVFPHGTKRYMAVDGVASRLGWVSAIS